MIRFSIPNRINLFALFKDMQGGRDEFSYAFLPNRYISQFSAARSEIVDASLISIVVVCDILANSKVVFDITVVSATQGLGLFYGHYERVVLNLLCM